MKGHADVGSAGIYGSVTVGASTTAMTWAEVINTNAMAIGIILTALSLVVGIVFKVVQMSREERHHREEMAAIRESNALQTEALRAEIRGLKG